MLTIDGCLENESENSDTSTVLYSDMDTFNNSGDRDMEMKNQKISYYLSWF